MSYLMLGETPRRNQLTSREGGGGTGHVCVKGQTRRREYTRYQSVTQRRAVRFLHQRTFMYNVSKFTQDSFHSIHKFFTKNLFRISNLIYLVQMHNLPLTFSYHGKNKIKFFFFSLVTSQKSNCK